MLNTGKRLFCAFIDFSKAFDSVKSRVEMQNKMSDAYECLLGVRQGESVSPSVVS